MELNDTVSMMLNQKGRAVLAISPEASVYDALQLMAQHDIGALAVMDGDRLVGMLSEREYARKVILVGKTSRETAVKEIMHPPDPAAGLDSTVDDCMRIITTARVRHLPVLDGGRVVGVVSIGDLVNWIIRAQEETIQQLHHYVAGNYPA